MNNLNNNSDDLIIDMPEIQKLKDLVGQYDFLLQEGITYNYQEWSEARKLIDLLSRMLDDIPIRKENKKC